ncbi:nucleotidyltransferase family protein [Polynucleobacter sp. MG-28-Ekke-A2]|uniref:nucleotidyltransferase family protein n=1 Tax=Polynucleobacter sp. MG-28-Ekke-A2 TaxID=3108276 RepID=UPI002B2291BC|nr:nucleotidyltransferase family protein [Polynucleobacter sp. MG-28-Ekke-A2]MEA9601208.1 nucleotidyltransferase family protein [Polynucleobacter sp. MG-28-Ekke-A2]
MALYVSSKLKHYRWLCKVISPAYLQGKSNLSIPVGDKDWREIIYLASFHGVLPSLFIALRNNQLLDSLPKDLSEALEGFYELNCLFNVQLRDQIISTTRLLNGCGIEPIWLKGAIHLLAPNWRQSSRTMADLDLWIPEPKEQLLAIEILTNDGYFIQPESVGKDYRLSQHYAPIIKSGQPARLEIHRHIVTPFCCALLNDEDALKKVVRGDKEGCSFGILSTEDQIMQSYLQCTEQGADCFNPRNTVGLMKMVDFLERFSSPDHLEKWFSENPQLNGEPWRLKARQFHSHLNCYFSIDYNGKKNSSYMRQVVFALNFPRLDGIYYIIKHGSFLLWRRKLGALNNWPGKLYRKLVFLKSL